MAGIALWGGAGYVLDRLLGTRPVLFVVGVLIGNAGGVYLCYLRTMPDGRGPRRRPGGTESPNDET